MWRLWLRCEFVGQTRLLLPQNVLLHVHCVLQRIEIGVRLHRAEMLVGGVDLLLRLLRLYRTQVLVQLYTSGFIMVTHCLCNPHRRSLSAFPIDYLMK